jgi:hypothetical protein
MNWLESQSVAGVSSILLTFITAWYAYLTWRLLRENTPPAGQRSAMRPPAVSMESWAAGTL